MDINNIGGGVNLGQLLGGGRKAAQPVKVDVPQVPVKQPAPQPVQVNIPDPIQVNVEAARAQRVREAAQALKGFFPVSDVRFTIFRDAAGDYITRFTSLKDGSVKYFPEKTMFQIVQERNFNLKLPIDLPSYDEQA